MPGNGSSQQEQVVYSAAWSQASKTESICSGGVTPTLVGEEATMGVDLTTMDLFPLRPTLG